MSYVKFIVFIFIMLIGIEFGTRIYFVPKVGWQALLFGTYYYKQFEYYYSPEKKSVVASSYRKDKEVLFPEVKRRGYYTYSPNTTKSDKDFKSNTLKVKINSEGFRGNDFSVVEPPGVYRIIALGASSTFGFGASDEMTYPKILEQLLNGKCKERPKVEVLNLGISNMTIEQIHNLFKGHGLKYRPKMAIFWEGRNDSYNASYNYVYRSLGFIKRALLYFQKSFNDYLLFARIFDGYSVNFEVKVDSKRIESRANILSESFIKELNSMARTASKNNIKFVVMNQQLRADLDPKSKINDTYVGELYDIQSKVSQNAILNRRELQFFFHGQIMKKLNNWKNDFMATQYVDMISHFDGHRELVYSEVHLTEEGNRRISNLIFNEISDEICPDGLFKNQTKIK